jgi:hypothetical protein
VLAFFFGRVPPKAPLSAALASARNDEWVEGSARVAAGTERRQVRTPHLTAVLQNARALLQVTSESTRLTVEEGEVIYRDRAGDHCIRAPSTVMVTRAPASWDPAECEPRAPADLSECLALHCGSDGLCAQNALYELAMRAHDRGALELSAGRFAAYLERFPQGILAPEASMQRMIDLSAARQTQLAIAEAERFLKRFPADPKASQVRAFRARLLDQRR